MCSSDLISSQAALRNLLGMGPGMGFTRTSDAGGGGTEEPGKPHDPTLHDRIETRLQELLTRTEELLAANRQQIFGLAHALETHKTISGEDVAAIIEGTQGPMVDGRLYQGEHFRALAESYHLMALQAHKEHAAVDVMLPILRGGPVPPPPPS